MVYKRITEEELLKNSNVYRFDIDWNANPPTFNNLEIIHILDIPKVAESEFHAVLFIPIIFNETIGVHGVEQYRLTLNETNKVVNYLETEKEISYDHLTRFLEMNVDDKPLLEPIKL